MPTSAESRPMPPDLGGILGGLPRPCEKEIRRKEPPDGRYYYCPGTENDHDKLILEARE